MSTPERCILQIAIATPLRRTFDYLPPDNISIELLRPGCRFLVPFGKRKHCIGFLISTSSHSELPFNRLKKALSLIDDKPIIKKSHLNFLIWAANYYQHPIGDVIFNALPSLLRKGQACRYPTESIVEINQQNINAQSLARAPKQKLLFTRIQSTDMPILLAELKQYKEYSAAAYKALLNKKFILQKEQIIEFKNETKQTALPKTNHEQQQAIDSIEKNTFNCYLLNGVTSSGKTLVYIKVIQQIIKSGKQALLLLPEISLTPQFIQRFKSAFATDVTLYHSGLSDEDRLNTWLKARDNKTQIIIGTRSAIWLPIKQPGIIIVDEEHDLSYKQQDGFRYSARDLAIIKAQKEKIPVLLGSATPSMESLFNVSKQRYQELKLKNRIADMPLPDMQLIDLKGMPMHGALSTTLIDAIRQTLAHGKQVLLFINRRGYAPAMLCHACGHIVICNRCDKTMTYHKQRNIFWCHHCDRQLPASIQCPTCSSHEWIECGHGTQRVEEDLNKCFPDRTIIRIDRDSTRHKGKFVEYLTQIQSGEADILIGTQMLSKGHHFPNLSLVGILDTDGGLYSTDFRASERMAQQLIQVSGRAGRAGDKGKVLIQTHHPEHPMLATLINNGYMAFAELLLTERAETGLPPFCYQALLRAEANNASLPEQFLKQAKQDLLAIQSGLNILGPIISPFQRKAGRFRMQLLIQAEKRSTLNQYLRPWINGLEQKKSAHSIRWALDIDPLDMM